MDNQRNKLHKFLKISQKHNKKYIYISEYIRFVLNFADELGDLTRTIHGSVEIHAPCRTSDPFANIPSFFQPVIPPSPPPISASIFVYAYTIRPLCVMRLQVAAMQGEEVARRKRGARPTSGWVRHPAAVGPDTQGVGRKVLSFRITLIIVARK